MLQTLKNLFDQDLKLVKEYLFNNFTKNYNEIDEIRVMVKENLIRTPNDIAPINIGLIVTKCHHIGSHSLRL